MERKWHPRESSGRKPLLSINRTNAHLTFFEMLLHDPQDFEEKYSVDCLDRQKWNYFESHYITLTTFHISNMVVAV